MRFKEFYLNEKYYKTIKDQWGNTTELFINPSKKDISDVLKKSSFKAIKGVLDDKNNIYIFDTDNLHKEAYEEATKNKYKNTFIAMHYGKGEKVLEVFYSNGKPTPKSKHKKVIDRLKGVFPATKAIFTYNVDEPREYKL